MLNNFCFHLYAQKVTLTLSLSHSFTHCTLNMLKNFCPCSRFNLSFTHSRHAEQVLFSSLCSKVAVYSRKMQWFVFDILIIIITLTCYFRCHRAGSQLKTSKIVTSSISRAGPLYRYWPVSGCSQTSGYLPISSPV